ncbi:HAD-superfamily phosphatase [Auriscalpium vulgare]|uniref:HAD-superfamily phosphatase n=1 Tax=Auriscalpium vulgare TaxID=40419 RepID=A0ACB8RNG8_9AGAM|nr:HAD-superfamily phosphatase [Auriscalpium vulgare]
MPFNLPGTLVPLYALFNPRLLLPSLTIADIRQLDFAALRKAGYRAVVFDKDNCLTIPHHDKLVPELKDAWRECGETFGPGNVLIVSNSAGTAEDPSLLQAESVTHHLRVPVLRHRSPKPSYSSADAVRAYFSSLSAPVAPHELVVVGDRIFTDVVLAKRIGQSESVFERIASRLWLPTRGKVVEKGGEDADERRVPLAIWTTGVWQRESMAMRYLETRLVGTVEKWIDGAADERRALEAKFMKPKVAEKTEGSAEYNKSKTPWLSAWLPWRRA